MFVSNVCKYRSGGKNKDWITGLPSNDKYHILDDRYRKHYNNVCKLYNKVIKNIDNGKSLKDCGINFISLNQSWLRNTNNVKNAEFSVMSPLFHNRFYVTNTKLLIKCGVNKDEIASYIKIIKYFTKIMQDKYGILNNGKGQSFINMDKLLE